MKFFENLKISKSQKFEKISKFQNLKIFENFRKKSQNRNLNFFFFWPNFFFQISKIFLGQISRKNYFGHPLISKMSIFGFWHLWNDGFFNIALEVRKQTNRDWVQNDRKSFSFRAVNFLKVQLIVWRRYGSPNRQKTVKNSKYADMACVWGGSVVCSSGYPHLEIFSWWFIM